MDPLGPHAGSGTWGGMEPWGPVLLREPLMGDPRAHVYDIIHFGSCRLLACPAGCPAVAGPSASCPSVALSSKCSMVPQDYVEPLFEWLSEEDMPSMQLFEYWWEDRWAFGKLPAHITAATKMAAVISASPTTTMHHPQGHRLNGPKGRALWAPWTPWVWGPMGSHGPPRGFKGFPGVVVVGVAPR